MVTLWYDAAHFANYAGQGKYNQVAQPNKRRQIQAAFGEVWAGWS